LIFAKNGIHLGAAQRSDKRIRDSWGSSGTVFELVAVQNQFEVDKEIFYI